MSVFVHDQGIKTVHAEGQGQKMAKFCPSSPLIVFALLQEMTVEGQRWVWDVAFSADSQYMFTASSDGVARLWSIPAKPEVKRTYKENGHTKAVTCLAFRDGTSMGKQLRKMPFFYYKESMFVTYFYLNAKVIE